MDFKMFTWQQINYVLFAVVNFQALLSKPASGNDMMPLALDVSFRPLCGRQINKRFSSTSLDNIPDTLAIIICLSNELIWCHGFGLLVQIYLHSRDQNHD